MCGGIAHASRDAGSTGTPVFTRKGDCHFPPAARALREGESEFCDAALDERSELLLDVRGQWLVVPGARFGEEIIEVLGDDTAEQ